MAGQELVNIIKRASLPALLLHVPDAEILAASAEAARLVGVPPERLVGRNVEEFAADSPGTLLGLIETGRVHGFQSPRQLLRADGQVEPLQVWVRGTEMDPPVTTAIAVLWPSGERAWTYVPGPTDDQVHAVIGTVDSELQIERVSDDVRALGSEPLDLIGQPFLRLFDVSSGADILHALAEAATSCRGTGIRVNLRVQQDPAMADLMVSPLNPAPSFSFSLLLGVSRDPAVGMFTLAGVERMGVSLHALAVAEMLSSISGSQVSGLHRLTTRELDIVARLLAGDRVPAIAKAVFLSPGTVRNHLSNVFHKLGVGSQQQLIELFRKSA